VRLRELAERIQMKLLRQASALPSIIDTGVQIRDHRGQRLTLFFCPDDSQSFFLKEASPGDTIECRTPICKGKRRKVITLRQAFAMRVVPICPGLSGIDASVSLDQVIWHSHSDLRVELVRRRQEEEERERRLIENVRETTPRGTAARRAGSHLRLLKPCQD
jgi:hypothetical protein